MNRLAALGLTVFAFSNAVTASAGCTLGVVDVTFGDYDVFNSHDTDITGSVSVSCDSDTTLQVALGAGNGSFSARRLQNGQSGSGNGVDLLYNLYLDSARLTIWGDGSPGTNVLGLSGLGGNYTVYGRIPARQNVSAGLYGDTIVVSLTF